MNESSLQQDDGLENVSSLSEENKHLKESFQFAFSMFGDPDALKNMSKYVSNLVA